MSEGGQTWFTVRINDEKMSELFVPHRISKLFRGNRKRVVMVYRGINTRSYDVKWVKVRTESGVEIYFKEGWSDFVKGSGIEYGDILDLMYMGDGEFKVSLWRGDRYIPEFIEISSDSSNDMELGDIGAEMEGASHNDAEIEDNDAEIERASHSDPEMVEASHNDAGSEEDTIFLPDYRWDWIPDFEVSYTSGYSAMGRLIVPLKFARLHFSFFGYENPADIWDNNNKNGKQNCL